MLPIVPPTFMPGEVIALRYIALRPLFPGAQHSVVAHGFFTPELAAAVRTDGERVLAAIRARTHPCPNGWRGWTPDPAWGIPSMPDGWDATPSGRWERAQWAYGIP